MTNIRSGGEEVENLDVDDYKIVSPPPGLIGWRRVGGLPLCFRTRQPVRDVLADKLDGDPEQEDGHCQHPQGRLDENQHKDSQRLQNQQEDNEHRQNQQSESRYIQSKHDNYHYI